MSARYDPADTPYELAKHNASINVLNSGLNQTILLLRLVSVWREPLGLPADEYAPLYTQWIDIQGQLIEGFTSPEDVALALPHLKPKTIFMFTTPSVILARPENRTCPFRYRLTVDLGDLLTPVAEDSERPFFPHDNFCFTDVFTLRNRANSHFQYTDVVGRLLSVSEPTRADDGSTTFKAVIQIDSSDTFLSHFVHIRAPHFNIAAIASLETKRPVLCIFTAMFVGPAPAAFPLECSLHSTASTRILLGSYRDNLKPLLHRFSHVHTPVRFVSTKQPELLKHVRGLLPRKVPVFKLISPYPDIRPRPNETIWCVLEIICIHSHRQIYYYSNGSPRFEMVATCGDASAPVDVIIGHDASILLLRMLPTEFVEMHYRDQYEAINSARSLCFVAEMYRLPAKHGKQADYYITTLWNKLAAHF